MFRLRNIRIRPKLIILFVLTGLIPLLIGGFFSTQLATQALVEKSFQQLLTVQSIQTDYVENLFQHRLEDLNTLAQSERITKLTLELEKYKGLVYQVPSGPFPVDSDSYKDLVSNYVDFYHHYNKTYDFRDLLLIEPKTGKVIFSVLQEHDLGTNLAYGRYRNSGLAAIWRKVYNSGQPEVVDFSPFVPSNGIECAFLGQPVLDAQGKMISIVVLQLSADFIAASMDSRSGLGKTGEAYLFNWDSNDDRYELRSNMQTMGDGKFVVGFSDLTPPDYWILATKKGEAGGQGIFTDAYGKKIPAPDQGGIAGKGLGGGQVLGAMVFPEPARPAKGGHPAFGRDPGSGEHRHPLGPGQAFTGQLQVLGGQGRGGRGGRGGHEVTSKDRGTARGRSPLMRAKLRPRSNLGFFGGLVLFGFFLGGGLFRLFRLFGLFGRGLASGGAGGAVLALVIGHIPAVTLEVKGVEAHDALKLAAAMGAFFQRLVGKFLQRLGDLAATATGILINRHIPHPLPCQVP